MQVINHDYEALFNGEEYAVAATDAAGVIVDANKQFQTLTGYTLDELKTLAYQDITPEHWMIYENTMIIKHVFSEGHGRYQKEYICKSGEIIPIEIDVYLLEEQNHNYGKLGLWAKVKRIETLSADYLEIKNISQ